MHLPHHMYDSHYTNLASYEDIAFIITLTVFRLWMYVYLCTWYNVEITTNVMVLLQLCKASGRHSNIIWSSPHILPHSYYNMNS